MAPKQTCDNCYDEFDGDPVRRGEKVFCCEACAFEASRSKDCGGRSDTTYAAPNVQEA